MWWYRYGEIKMNIELLGLSADHWYWLIQLKLKLAYKEPARVERKFNSWHSVLFYIARRDSDISDVEFWFKVILAC